MGCFMTIRKQQSSVETMQPSSKPMAAVCTPTPHQQVHPKQTAEGDFSNEYNLEHGLLGLLPRWDVALEQAGHTAMLTELWGALRQVRSGELSGRRARARWAAQISTTNRLVRSTPACSGPPAWSLAAMDRECAGILDAEWPLDRLSTAA